MTAQPANSPHSRSASLFVCAIRNTERAAAHDVRCVRSQVTQQRTCARDYVLVQSPQGVGRTFRKVPFDKIRQVLCRLRVQLVCDGAASG